jgi:hypothetical protein
MRTYRAYQIDSTGSVTGPPTIIEAASDAEAVLKAMQSLDGFDIEVWDEARRVGKIEHRRDQRPG